MDVPRLSELNIWLNISITHGFSSHPRLKELFLICPDTPDRCWLLILVDRGSLVLSVARAAHSVRWGRRRSVLLDRVVRGRQPIIQIGLDLCGAGQQPRTRHPAPAAVTSTPLLPSWSLLQMIYWHFPLAISPQVCRQLSHFVQSVRDTRSAIRSSLDNFEFIMMGFSRRLNMSLLYKINHNNVDPWWK